MFLDDGRLLNNLRELVQGARIVNGLRVESKMLAAIAYNDDWHHLFLEFRSGDIYCYRNVPVGRYDELRVTDSKGKYCRRHILNRYPYQRIHRAFRTAS